MKKFIFGFITALFVLTPLFTFSAPSLGEKLKGKILLNVDDKGKTYYITNGNRYRITKETALEIFKKLALGISDENLKQIPEANVGIDPEIQVLSADTTECSVCEVCPVQNTASSCEPVIKEVTKTVYVDKPVYIDRVTTVNNCDTGSVGSVEETPIEYSSYVIKYKIITNESYSGQIYVAIYTPTTMTRDIRIKKIAVSATNVPLDQSVGIKYPEKPEPSVLTQSGDKWYWNNQLKIQRYNNDYYKINLYIPSSNAINTTISPIFDEWVAWDYTSNQPVKMEEI